MIWISVQQQKQLTLNNLHWLFTVQDTTLPVVQHCIIQHDLVLTKTFTIFKLKGKHKAEARKTKTTMPMRHRPQQNYNIKTTYKNPCAFKMILTKYLEVKCVIVTWHPMSVLIPLEVLRHTCLRSNIICDCHLSQAMQQYIFFFKHGRLDCKI